MYKVLVADDEPTIREGLRTLIDWEAFGYTVVDTAASGRDALSKYERHRPDLIIIDIKMPGIDGLETIERLRARDKRLHMLILSGYAEFDYARRAMAHRIDGYMLKPVDEDELIDYLRRLRQTLDREAAERERAAGWTAETVIRSLLSGTPAAALAEPAARAGLDGSTWEAVVIRPHCRQPDPYVLEEGGHRLARALASPDRICYTAEGDFGVLVAGGLGGEAQREALLKSIADALAGLGLDFTAASGGAADDWTGIPQSHARASAALRRAFFLEQGRIHPAAAAEHGPDGAQASDPPDLSDLTDKLAIAIDVANEASIGEWIREAGKRLLVSGADEEAVKASCGQLVSAVAARLEAQRPRTVDGLLQFSLVELYKACRFTQLMERMGSLMIAFAREAGQGGTETQVKKMIDIIHRHYDRSLKLETIAGLLNYSSAYLGKVFKHKTGENFNTYLDKVRIEEAKKLLLQGMKVYEVAERVGYANVDYFHGKFRKYVGMSPAAFRKRAGGS
jgi:two-component system response regulator YesN